MLDKIIMKIGELDLGVTEKNFIWFFEKDDFHFTLSDNSLTVLKGNTLFEVELVSGSVLKWNDNGNIFEVNKKIKVLDFELDIVNGKFIRSQIFGLLKKYGPNSSKFPSVIRLKIDGNWITINDKGISGTDSHSLRKKLKKLMPSKKRWVYEEYKITDKQVDKDISTYMVEKNGVKTSLSTSDKCINFGYLSISVEFRNDNKFVYTENIVGSDKAYTVFMNIKEDVVCVNKFEKICTYCYLDNYADYMFTPIPGGYVNMKHFLEDKI